MKTVSGCTHACMHAHSQACTRACTHRRLHAHVRAHTRTPSLSFLFGATFGDTQGLVLATLRHHAWMSWGTGLGAVDRIQPAGPGEVASPRSGPHTLPLHSLKGSLSGNLKNESESPAWLRQTPTPDRPGLQRQAGCEGLLGSPGADLLVTPTSVRTPGARWKHRYWQTDPETAVGCTRLLPPRRPAHCYDGEDRGPVHRAKPTPESPHTHATSFREGRIP